MATFKLLQGLGVTVVLRGIAGARLGFLYRVGASAQPVEPGRVGRTGDIAPAEVLLPEVLLRSEVLLHSVRPHLDDASSSGATTPTTSTQ